MRPSAAISGARFSKRSPSRTGSVPGSSQTPCRVAAPRMASRYGGEEFAVLIGPTSLAQAAALIDVARATVAAKRFRNRETDRSLGAVTMSVGITTVRAGETGEQAFVRADQLLYKAKTAGRNRVLAE